jgi:hypothetical protein
VSADLELWTREAPDLGVVLPGEWDDRGDEFEREGDGWLVTVSAPEEDDDVPEDLSARAGGLRYRVPIAVERDLGPDALALVREILNAVGGAAIDPESGHSRIWPA